MLGPGSAAYRLEHAGEDLGGEVVGGVGVAAAGAGVAAHGVRVAPVQLLVRRVVAGAHPLDQRGVGRRHPRRRRNLQRQRKGAALALGRDTALAGIAALRLGGKTPGLPWLGTCGEAIPPASGSPSPSDSSRPSTLIAESPAACPTSPEHGSGCHIGFWSGPHRTDPPLVRGDFPQRSTGVHPSGEGSTAAPGRRVGNGDRNARKGSRASLGAWAAQRPRVTVTYSSHPRAGHPLSRGRPHRGRDRSPSSRMSSSRAEAAACCAASGSEGAAVAITSRTSDTDTSARNWPAARARSTS